MGTNAPFIPFGGSTYLPDPNDPTKVYYMNTPQYSACQQYYANVGYCQQQNKKLHDDGLRDYEQWAVNAVQSYSMGVSYHDAPPIPQQWTVKWDGTKSSIPAQDGPPAYIRQTPSGAPEPVLIPANWYISYQKDPNGGPDISVRLPRTPDAGDMLGGFPVAQTPALSQAQIQDLFAKFLETLKAGGVI